MSLQAEGSLNFSGMSALQQEPGMHTLQSSAGERAFTTSFHGYQGPISSVGTQEQALISSLLSDKTSTSAEPLEETDQFLSLTDFHEKLLVKEHGHSINKTTV